MERYAKSAPGTTSPRAEDTAFYRSGPICHHQQCKAAVEELIKRCRGVLDPRDYNDMPSREFELVALQAREKQSCKALWYALTKTNNLLIVKYAPYISREHALDEIVLCEVTDENGNQIPNGSTDNNLTIDLGEV